MSAIPAFEIGIWNAWIFMVPFLLVNLLFFLLMIKKGAPSGPSRVPYKSKITLLFGISSKIIYLPAIVYSVFLPLKLGTIWFYIGLPITLIGLLGSIVIMVNWAVTPVGKPVTKGLYRYSRHPIYVTGVFMLLGVSIISASWVFLVLTIIFGVGATRPYFVKIEEAQCLGHYGAPYREYMSRTPRWIGIPKSKKQD
jgi:protein-S-isoprenylcysteine O-methyltransferase Ste14